MRTPLWFPLFLIVTSVVVAEEKSLGDLFDEVKDTVVIIRTKEKGFAPTIERKFTKLNAIGSGVIISEDGKVMTAAHVVNTADEITVELLSGQTSRAYVLASATVADVALLQMERMPRIEKPAVLADSNEARIGDQVFVVGAPYGFSHTLTVGHLSARHEPDTLVSLSTRIEFLQTDAAINQGNSGGPMFNMKGEVIGICSHIMSTSGGSEGLGFAAASNVAQNLLLKKKSFWAGTEVIPVEGEIAEALNLPQGYGFLVQRVADASPSARMGLKGGTLRALVEEEELVLGGDIIIEIMGIPLESREAAFLAYIKLSELKEGEVISCKVLRAGKVRELRTFVLPEL